MILIYLFNIYIISYCITTTILLMFVNMINLFAVGGKRYQTANFENKNCSTKENIHEGTIFF